MKRWSTWYLHIKVFKSVSHQTLYFLALKPTGWGSVPHIHWKSFDETSNISVNDSMTTLNITLMNSSSSSSLNFLKTSIQKSCQVGYIKVIFMVSYLFVFYHQKSIEIRGKGAGPLIEISSPWNIFLPFSPPHLSYQPAPAAKDCFKLRCWVLALAHSHLVEIEVGKAQHTRICIKPSPNYLSSTTFSLHMNF